jgi:hypothetical protein
VYGLLSIGLVAIDEKDEKSFAPAWIATGCGPRENVPHLVVLAYQLTFWNRIK